MTDENDATIVEQEGQIKLTKIIKWRLLELNVTSQALKEFGFWEVAWGFDIFIGRVPFLKSVILANTIAWLILFLTN